MAGTELCLHLSPGTPAMAAVWLLLGKTCYPATFYEIYGGQAWVTEVPFDLTIDVIPEIFRDPDAHWQHLAAESPSQVEGFQNLLGDSPAICEAAGRAKRQRCEGSRSWCWEKAARARNCSPRRFTRPAQGETSRCWQSTVPPSRRRSWNRNCSAIRGERSREKGQIITIEQPEVHVHPRLQADIADLLIDSIQEPRKHQFIVETHSEHLILRLQRRIREHVISPDDVAVIFVKRGPNGAEATRLRLDEDGDFVDEWPGGFFPERLNELR